MKHLLIPIDGTSRSLKTISFVKDLYKPNEVHITLLMVREDIELLRSEQDYELAKKELEPLLDCLSKELNEYQGSKRISFGRAAETILEIAETEGVNIIAMTKSTRHGLYRMIGSVTTHIVKYASCIVMIVPE